MRTSCVEGLTYDQTSLFAVQACLRQTSIQYIFVRIFAASVHMRGSLPMSRCSAAQKRKVVMAAFRSDGLQVFGYICPRVGCRLAYLHVCDAVEGRFSPQLGNGFYASRSKLTGNEYVMPTATCLAVWICKQQNTCYSEHTGNTTLSVSVD